MVIRSLENNWVTDRLLFQILRDFVHLENENGSLGLYRRLIDYIWKSLEIFGKPSKITNNILLVLLTGSSSLIEKDLDG